MRDLALHDRQDDNCILKPFPMQACLKQTKPIKYNYLNGFATAIYLLSSRGTKSNFLFFLSQTCDI